MLTSEELLEKYFHSSEHPYKTYENEIENSLNNVGRGATLLDAGCGRTAPVLSKFIGKANKLIGVDLENPLKINQKIQYLKGDISNINIPSDTVDLVISRAVLEHTKQPDPIFLEINRILKKDGCFIFLVPNAYDYVSIASKLIPNKFHGKIVAATEGRKIEDVFPAYYKANSFLAIKRLCQNNNFQIVSFAYLGQYPASLMFNPYIFLIGTFYEKVISNFDTLKFLRGWLLVKIRKK